MIIGQYLTALIRTGVPALVGWLLSLPLAGPILSALGVDTATADRYVTAALTAGFGLAYYALVHWAEQRFPQLGVLLGVPSKPTYNTAATPADDPTAIPDTPDPLAPIHDASTPGASAPATS